MGKNKLTFYIWHQNGFCQSQSLSDRLSDKRLAIQQTSNMSLCKNLWSTYFTWNSTLYFSFNHIISLIHPLIGKLKALAHKFSISWGMCALDWLFTPNLYIYQLWPSLAAEEYDQTIDTHSLTPS